jgi:hypothetical protein
MLQQASKHVKIGKKGVGRGLTGLAFVTESGRSPRRRELVEPGPMRRDRDAPASMRRDMEPPASRCWWMAMASACRCRSSSSAGVSFGPPRADRVLPIRLLRDTAAAARCSLRGTHANALPIGRRRRRNHASSWSGRRKGGVEGKGKQIGEGEQQPT